MVDRLLRSLFLAIIFIGSIRALAYLLS